MQTSQYNTLNELYFQDLDFSHAEERNNEIVFPLIAKINIFIFIALIIHL